MKRRLLIIVILLFITSFSYGYGEEFLRVKVSTSLGEGLEGELKSESGFIFLDPESKVETNRTYENRINFTLQDNVVILKDQLGLEIGRLDSLDLIYPLDENTRISYKDKSYRGGFFFLINNRSLSVINYIGLEDYLYSVVPKEMGPKFHSEALKVQSIISRTFAKYTHKHDKEGFDLCDTTHCQVYGGYDSEHIETNMAVDATRGLKIYYDNNLIDAVFHSNNGGYMESGREAWGGEVPYLISKKDDFSENTTASNWTYEISRADLKEALIKNSINIGDILSIDILDRTSSDRVKSLSLKGSLGEETITASKLRTILGPSQFRSNLFYLDQLSPARPSASRKKVVDSSGLIKDIDMSTYYIITSRGIELREDIREGQGSSQVIGDSIKFIGKGYGHGVGLSQYGALAMAKAGYGYEDIIKYYYYGVEIR